MIPALLRRDPAVRALPKWILVGALITSALGGVRVLVGTIREADNIAPAHFGDYLLLALALWIPVALFLALGNTGLRCNRLDLTLPISASRLNAAHLGGVLLSGSIVLAVASGVVLFHDWALGFIPGKVSPQPGVGDMFVFAVIALILTAAGLLGAQPSVYRTPSGNGRAFFVTTYLFGGLGLILVLSFLPLAVSLLPLAVAAVLIARSFRGLPSALTLVPLPGVEGAEPAGEERWKDLERPTPASDSGTQRAGFPSLHLNLTLYKILALGIAPVQLLRVPINVIAIPFLIGMGLILSGFPYDTPIRLTNVTLAAYMLLAFLAAPMAQMHLLDPLPISRRRIFALLVLPGLLAVAAGYGAGRIGAATSEERPSIQYTSQITRGQAPPYRSSFPTLRVPYTEFRTAWNGEVPPIESPWGESHEAWRIPLYSGSRAMVYLPFSTPEGSSVDFVALQISRAVEAVYGRTIPYEEIRERYLETSPEGVVSLRNPSGLTLLEDYPELSVGGEGPLFPVAILITGLLYLGIGSLYLRTYRASISEGKRKAAFFAVLGGTLVLHITPFIAFISGFVEDWVVLGQAEAGLLWLARTLPGGEAAVWVLCAAILYAGYRLAQGAFERIEVPLPRPKQVA